MDNCRRRMLAHMGQPLYAKTEQRFDIRRRCRSRRFYYIVKVQVEATSSKIGPECCRIAAFVLDRNGKLNSPMPPIRLDPRVAALYGR